MLSATALAVLVWGTVVVGWLGFLTIVAALIREAARAVRTFRRSRRTAREVSP